MMPSQFLDNDARSIRATSTFLTSASPTFTDSTVVARAATGPPAPCAGRPVADSQQPDEFVLKPSFSAVWFEITVWEAPVSTTKLKGPFPFIIVSTVIMGFPDSILNFVMSTHFLA